MSILVSSLVWKFSRQKSGNLLVLLAIADHADDDGVAWPGIARLAKMTRLSERHVRRCLTALSDAGELEILPAAAPSGGTLYQIRLKFLTAPIGTAMPAKVTPVSGAVDVDVIPSIREPSEEPSIETDPHSVPVKILKSSLRPELDEVLLFVSQKKDLDPAVAGIWWHECEACGWVDSHSRSIVRWQSALIAYSQKWRANNYKPGQPSSFGDPTRKRKECPPSRRPAQLSSAPKNGF